MSMVRWAALALLVIAPSCALGTEPGAGDTDTTEIVVEGVEVAGNELGRVVATALDDDRLGELLAAHPHRVEGVRPPVDGSGFVVTVGFDAPLVDDAAWPLDVCAINTGGQPITGIVWLVEDGSVRAVSPRWGDDLACGY
jgi:hypothetical protein